MTVHGEAAINRQWLLRGRPVGALTLDDFALEPSPLRAPGDGEAVIKVHYLALDPAIRGFMNDSGSYAAPIEPGQPVRGMVLGEVVESRAPTLAQGDVVSGFGSWSDYVVAPGGQWRRAVGSAPNPDLLHRRGSIGLTAYYGLTRIAGIRPGDRVLVSGAAGAVGSLAGQMARLLGAGQIVGIAGGQEKCGRAVARYGYDECVDYKATADLEGAIRQAMPDGIDVYFDNVGGDMLAAAINLLRKNGRIALCGMISGYDKAVDATRPPNLWNLIVQTAGMRGFRVTDMLDDHAFVTDALAEIDGWIAGGLRGDLDIRQGLENAPAAFLSLFSGGNAGRLLVHVDEDGW